MLNLIGLKEVIVNELKNRLKLSGLNLPVETLQNEIVLTIPRDEISKQLLSSFPDFIKPYIIIEASDIRVKIRLG